MNSSSSSPYLKHVSCKHKYMGGFQLFAKSLFKLPLHHSCNNHRKKSFDFRLAISTRRPLLPLSQTQAQVENHDLKIEEEPSNGYIIEVDTEAEKGHEQTVHVIFQLQRECSFGQNFVIVGDHPMLGLWDPNNALPLTWSEGHLWTVDLDIPTRKCIKFKFIMQEGNGKFVWQPGPDRVLEFWETSTIVTLCEDWENPDLRTITEADPTFNQVEESVATIDFKTVAADEVMPVEPSVISTNDVSNLKTSSTIAQCDEPEGYGLRMKEVLEPDEAVPVLVPGLSQIPMADTQEKGSVTESLKDEEDVVNGAATVSAGADSANSLKWPEVNA